VKKRRKEGNQNKFVLPKKLKDLKKNKNGLILFNFYVLE